MQTSLFYDYSKKVMSINLLISLNLIIRKFKDATAYFPRNMPMNLSYLKILTFFMHS